MPVQRQAHIKKNGSRNAHVLIAGEDVQDKSQHCNAEHQPAHDEEHAQIPFQQRVVDEQFRDVRLQQAECRGGDARQEHKNQARPIRDDEA